MFIITQQKKQISHVHMQGCASYIQGVIHVPDSCDSQLSFDSDTGRGPLHSHPERDER